MNPRREPPWNPRARERSMNCPTPSKPARTSAPRGRVIVAWLHPRQSLQRKPVPPELAARSGYMSVAKLDCAVPLELIRVGHGVIAQEIQCRASDIRQSIYF